MMMNGNGIELPGDTTLSVIMVGAITSAICIEKCGR